MFCHLSDKTCRSDKTCHNRVHVFSCSLPPHFWQNNRDLLRAAAVSQGWKGYRNKTQHRALTLGKKNLLPLSLPAPPPLLLPVPSPRLLKGGRGCLMSFPGLESCHFIPLSYLLLFFCLVLFLFLSCYLKKKKNPANGPLSWLSFSENSQTFLVKSSAFFVCWAAFCHMTLAYDNMNLYNIFVYCTFLSILALKFFFFNQVSINWTD